MSKKQLIIVPGYFKSGSTLMYTYIWPKLGFKLLPKRLLQSKNLIHKIYKHLKKNDAKIAVYNGRRIDFDLCHTHKQSDEILLLLRSIFEVTKSDKVVAELGFLRPGVPDSILMQLREPIQILRSEGVSVKFLFYIRGQSDLILSRIKHDYRSFPPYLLKQPDVNISAEYLMSIFSNDSICRCIYPFCLSNTVDALRIDCIGDCGFLGKKVYQWSFYDFFYQLKRFQQLAGSDDVYVQPLQYLLNNPEIALNRLAKWAGAVYDKSIFQEKLPLVGGAPDKQALIKLSMDGEKLISDRYRASNQELLHYLDIPDDSLNIKNV